MRPIILDASVAAKWFTSEPGGDAAAAYMRSGIDLYAPDFFLIEMDNLLAKFVRRGDMTRLEAEEARETLAGQPILYFETSELRDHAWEIATMTGRAMYDCLYVALAVALEGVMVTADARLAQGLMGTPFGEYVELTG
ncbi:type II toxin-antitoxin system VapC family toxin [Desulfovibrio sulfodismutans]|uniref:Type II toxin-antitoxin system VapC family toxin n=1 Tax=Desulfolutivibrio sulfodismutans TaxID=63561 RepID=A0A7K3NQ80_9BACT|nr:type II toxin-antitoxin system VapC family toxin [Desulfolutivibrio sulfodismutans]NDY58372.1 type II toxin-antitoxin system VapC family toxin [Desulfolutivibrio sulfodismutans]QLA13774.1 PIN domain-containing protein [Desulfolutivibrio sulfodismutans DSM 3696]